LEKAVFIFPFNRRLSESESLNLLTEMQQFFAQWNSHGQAIHANAKLDEERFLIVHIVSGQPGGCSKDKLFHQLDEIKGKLGLQLEPEGRFLIGQKDEILSFSRKELKDKQLEGSISPDSILFPTWISDQADFDSLWKKPVTYFPALFPSRDLV
jgi:hypothetical protein